MTKVQIAQRAMWYRLSAVLVCTLCSTFVLLGWMPLFIFAVLAGFTIWLMLADDTTLAGQDDDQD